MSAAPEADPIEEPDVPLEEPADPDDDPAPDEDPEQPDETQPADEDDVIEQAALEISERAVKAREKALEKEYTRHEGVLERAWGTLWEQFVCCPLCEGDGFMTPKPAGAMEAEQFAAVTALAGQMQSPDFPDDQDFVVCSNCKGWGNTNIAASEREGLSKQCNRCLGAGYVASTAVSAPVIPFPVIPQQVTATGGGVVSFGAPGPDDTWGRPTGHPHYGIDPKTMT